MAEFEFVLPKFGVAMEEGTVEEWLVAEGEVISEGQDMVVVSTDKVDNTIESPVAGTITQLTVAEGETVPAGAVLALISS